MKKSVNDWLFSKKFQDDVSRETLENYRNKKKENPASAVAGLIAYVLKFKKKELPAAATHSDDFSVIRQHSIETFRNTSSGKISIAPYFRIAAVASVLLLFGVAGYLAGDRQLFSTQSEQAEIIEFKTPKGQQSELTLPDGSEKILNYDSKLTYRISASKSLREVELEGQAFFKVPKDQSRTFRVITTDMSVNVLGTEFDVRAYRNDLKTETTLLEGSVEIQGIPNQQEPVLLKPGEQWSFNKTTGKHAVVAVDVQLATLWRAGEYYFDKIALGELSKTLERMYQVNIHFQDSSLENEVYSGSVYQGEDISELFELINLTVPVKINVAGDDIWIARK